MRITAVRAERLRVDLDPPFHAAWDPVPRRVFDAALVRVETDEGLVGVASGDTLAGLDDAAHLFVGHDPLAIARHARVIETVNFHGGRLWPLEAALWDIAGQAAGVPAATLLGGARDRLPAYASTGAALPPDDRAESALALRERGFRAMKIRVDRTRPAAGVAAVRAVRDAVGPDFTIMVDLNQAWRTAGDAGTPLDRPAVRSVVAELAELGVFWVEEPLPYADVAGMAELRAATGARVAAGEMLATPADVLALMDADALDVYQMDAVLSVGMSRTRTLGELALLRGRSFTPHTWSNGLGLLANLHVVAGVGGGPYVEFPYDPPGWTPARRDFFLAEPVDIDADGNLRVPGRPGLGAVLDEDAVSRHRVA
ncbi:MAG TPA: mandelate racemase/muconate lactonizing enzyme family protein [Streptosporangiaceae bacterium]|jgi:L-alanine-DL-glutamate epimerase-like enolase superfamily enzyme